LDAFLYSFELDDQSSDIVNKQPRRVPVPVLGLLNQLGVDSGRVVVFGDSSCLDDSHQDVPCYWLLQDMLAFASTGLLPESYGKSRLVRPFVSSSFPIPKYPKISQLPTFSKVINQPLVCPARSYITWRDDPNTSPSRAAVHFKKPVYSLGPENGDALPRFLSDGSENTRSAVRASGASVVKSFILPWLGVCGVLMFLVTLFRRRRESFRFMLKNSKGVAV
jgi:membrane-bound transcription factor site-1 protease